LRQTGKRLPLPQLRCHWRLCPLVNHLSHILILNLNCDCLFTNINFTLLIHSFRKCAALSHTNGERFLLVLRRQQRKVTPVLPRRTDCRCRCRAPSRSSSAAPSSSFHRLRLLCTPLFVSFVSFASFAAVSLSTVVRRAVPSSSTVTATRGCNFTIRRS
jgi:hypothetical protein